MSHVHAQDIGSVNSIDQSNSQPPGYIVVTTDEGVLGYYHGTPEYLDVLFNEMEDAQESRDSYNAQILAATASSNRVERALSENPSVGSTSYTSQHFQFTATTHNGQASSVGGGERENETVSTENYRRTQINELRRAASRKK